MNILALLKRFKAWAIRPSNWRFVLDDDHWFPVEIRGRKFENEWVKLDTNGWYIVKKGYAWNGCNPKLLLFGTFYVGTWDGFWDDNLNMPVTGRASLLHDSLLQFGDEMGVLPSEAAREFCNALDRSGFFLRKLYCCAVKKFGPQDQETENT